MTLFPGQRPGRPVSTTHTITGAIVGVGSTRSVNSVRWGVAGNIVWAWIFTDPGLCAYWPVADALEPGAVLSAHSAEEAWLSK